jgi:hypothetical protein
MKNKVVAGILLTYVFFHHQLAMSESVIDELVTCSETKNSLKRLICFDEAVKELKAYDGKQITNRSYSPSRTSPKGSSNQKSVPKSEIIATTEKIEEFGRVKNTSTGQSRSNTTILNGELHSTIVDLIEMKGRRLKFVLENGQVWEKTEGGKAGLPKVGEKVIIRSESLGAFYLRRAASKRSFKVKRIDNE